MRGGFTSVAKAEEPDIQPEAKPRRMIYTERRRKKEEGEKDNKEERKRRLKMRAAQPTSSLSRSMNSLSRFSALAPFLPPGTKLSFLCFGSWSFALRASIARRFVCSDVTLAWQGTQRVRRFSRSHSPGKEEGLHFVQRFLKPFRRCHYRIKSHWSAVTSPRRCRECGGFERDPGRNRGSGDCVRSRSNDCSAAFCCTKRSAPHFFAKDPQEQARQSAKIVTILRN